MLSTDDTLRRRLLVRLPDLPCFLEARALLASGHCSVYGDERGALVRNEEPGGSLVALVGRPSVEALHAALDGRPRAELLCPISDMPALAELLPERERLRAVLHELRHPERLPSPDPRVRALDASDDLSHLPPQLREEVECARKSRAIWAAFEDGRAASFAYAFWRTERWFDLSVDTAPAFRRRGLARAAVGEAIRSERAQGREPVWGALASNATSLRLAARIGFEPTDEVVVAPAPRGEKE